MSFSHGSKARVLGNGYNLSLFLREVSTPYTVDSAECSTFGNTHKNYVPGLLSGTLDVQGLFDGATDAVDQIFDAMLTGVGDDIFTYMPQGDVLGSRARGMKTVTTNYNAASGIGDVSTVQLQGQNNIGAEAGPILHVLTAEAAPGNGTGVDMTTVTTTNGWAAFLHVVSGTDLIVKIQDSANGSVWADLSGALFSEFDARGAQRIESAAGATVRQHARVSWTGTGTFHVLFNRK